MSKKESQITTITNYVEDNEKDMPIVDVSKTNDTSKSKQNTLKEPTFNETFDHFLVFCERVLESTTDSLGLKLSRRPNAILIALNGYKKVYNETRNSLGHKELFAAIYNKCRYLFIKNTSLHEFMEWFKKAPGMIIAPQTKSRNKIMLSAIFRKCCKIAEDIEEEADKYPVKSDELYNDPAAIYPETFMLNLFRMFGQCCDKTDKNTIIKSKIKEIEDSLGLDKDQNYPESDGVSQLFSTAKDLARNIGIEIPENSPNMSGRDFQNALNSVIGDSNTKNALKDIFKGINLKDQTNIPDVIGKVLNRMKDNAKNIPEPLKKSLEATSTKTEL